MKTLGHLQHEPHHSIGEGRIALLGLLTIQAFLGYEWLMSGLTKVVRGGFPSGLADELTEKSKGAAGWYADFLESTVIPNAKLFGYLIMLGEMLIGVVLIAAAAAWLWRWERLSHGGRVAVLAGTALASVAAIFMNVNFHVANGSSHPWLIPADGFDEGVDMDSLLPLLEIVLLVVSATLLRRLRRAPASGPQLKDERTPSPA